MEGASGLVGGCMWARICYYTGRVTKLLIMDLLLPASTSEHADAGTQAILLLFSQISVEVAFSAAFCFVRVPYLVGVRDRRWCVRVNERKGVCSKSMMTKGGIQKKDIPV